MKLVGELNYHDIEINTTSERGEYVCETVEKINDHKLSKHDFIDKLDIKIIKIKWEGKGVSISGNPPEYSGEAKINEHVRANTSIYSDSFRITLPEFITDDIDEKSEIRDPKVLFKIDNLVTYEGHVIPIKNGFKTRIKDILPFDNYDWGINHRPTKKQTIKIDSEKIDFRSDSDSEISEDAEDLTNNQDSRADTKQNPQQRPTRPAYVASVTDTLTTKAEQTSKASECNKYLNELRDTLKESDLEGETYDDILEELDTIIYRVESEGFSEDLDDKKVQQIEDISHRIKRLCQR